ncbi:MAG: YjgN family protein [Hyphomicrobiaceae bacterium]
MSSNETSAGTFSNSSQSATTNPNLSGSASNIGHRRADNGLRFSATFPDGLVDLSFINLILNILTLGIYSFWARTNVRKCIWSAVRFNDEPLTYTGTGKELMIGFLIVFAIVLLPVTLLMTGLILLIGDANSPIVIGAQVSVGVVFFYLYGVAAYSAQRYILSRTTWRGIRGHLSGSSWKYGWTAFWTAILIIPTLGWVIPWRATKLQKIITNETKFGGTPLRFEGSSKPLYKPFAVFWLTVTVVLVAIAGIFGGIDFVDMISADMAPEEKQRAGAKMAFILIMQILFGYLVYKVMSAWYRARAFNYFASITKLQDAVFKGTATGPSLVKLAITNYLITIFTFSILSPVVLGRRTFYFVNRLALEGPVDFNAISQAEKQDITHGEGLAQALDVNIF